VSNEDREAVVARLSGYDRVVEVGVGNRPDVADALADRGVDVVATDVHERPVPDGVRFAHEDVTDPDPRRYEGVDAVYALNCPPELQRPLRAAARSAGAACLFTTLGADPAVVPATREQLPTGTLFVAHDGPGRTGEGSPARGSGTRPLDRRRGGRP
jgi:uncharacterized UPF0146 family protein